MGVRRQVHTRVNHAMDAGRKQSACLPQDEGGRGRDGDRGKERERESEWQEDIDMSVGAFMPQEGEEVGSRSAVLSV